LKRSSRYKTSVLILTGLCIWAIGTSNPYQPSAEVSLPALSMQEPDSVKNDGELIFPLKETSGNPLLEREEGGVIDPGMPDNIEYTTEYDAKTNQVTLYRKMGDINVRLPYTMSLEDYMDVDTRNSMINYWHQRQQMESGQMTEASFFNQKFKLGGEGFKSMFGGNNVDVKMQGVAELKVGVMHTRIDNPTLQQRLRKTTTFDFDQNIQMNITGNIGDKLKLGINYNTQALFEFENEIKLQYTGKEDEIIKSIEAGNVSMPLPGTLITGSQSLFGVKTEMQFGKLTMTTIFSQQKGQSQVINIEGGAMKQEFEVAVDQYDKNRHFFLSNAFRDQYEQVLANLPVVASPYAITKIEVWVTNKTNNYNDSRNIVAYLDLGENDPNIYSNNWSDNNPANTYPSNDANNLYYSLNHVYFPDSTARNINDVSSTLQGVMANSKEYEKVENARRLSSSDYTVNTNLGYISLNTALQADEVLAVAYEYTYYGTTHKVGEFTNDGITGDAPLWLKLVKSTALSPSVKPMWNLMMKNVYALGAYQVNSDDFNFDIYYVNDSTGTNINYFPEGSTAPSGIKNQMMLRVMNLDTLNSNMDVNPDGVFDFIEGVTINPQNGRVFFPVLEPFGSHLKAKLNNQTSLINKYVYQELYDSTLTNASQTAEKNKFVLKGSYKSSSSSEISLNATNIPQGSVVVTSGGLKLTENIDYTVDYTLGRIKIINSGILQSGSPIQVSLESQSLYATQTKTLMGTHLDYKFNDNFNIGGTIMHLSERPLTQKVNIGDEPISNTIWGLNTSFTTESQGLTNLLDKLPGLVLKQPSKINFEGEFAQLIPGHSKVIGSEGAAYIDDFEGTKISYDLKNWTSWKFASTPQGQSVMFPQGSYTNSLQNGYRRAKLAWYTIDPIFTRDYAETPSHIANDKDQLSNHFVREIYESELFPEKEVAYGTPTNIPILNFAYYPKERGPYNFDYNNIDEKGFLANPADNWGGIMRKIETPDFEAANIEYIEFWLMDPFVYDDSPTRGGDLYFDLGNVSEDILRDSRKSFEQGLPGDGEENLVDTTVWGKVPQKQSLVNAFSSDPASRQLQDVGLDGLSNDEEKTFYDLSFIQKVNDAARPIVEQDPAADKYHYYRGTDFDDAEVGILDRYKNFNNPEGNAVATEYSPESYSTAASSIPDVEDINGDNTLSESESYYQYKVEIRPDKMIVGQNYIADMVSRAVELKNGTTDTIRWYQFKIPLSEPDTAVNGISDFTSIRFMRMFMNNATDTTILRFASLDLVRGDWRTYKNTMIDPNDDDATNAVENANTKFTVSAVNIEENSDRVPINYVLPPGVDRVIDPANPQMTQLNEQAISLKAVDLGSKDARAVYKTVNMDMRQYKKLKMYVHAEALEGDPLENGEIVAFIRLGSDYKNNYYEYEIPLKLTPYGVYGDNSADRYLVWPEENAFNIELEKLTQAKLRRNDEKRQSGSTVTLSDVYRWNDPDNPVNIIKVKGNPNLSNVKTIMMGIRVRGSQTRSAEVWMNELRLTDFNEDGGWAANARVKVDLSDLGSISAATKKSTVGFGSIDQSVNERSQEDFSQYDIATNLEAGKFLGPNSRLSVPLYLGTSKAVTNPKYYALDPDIPIDVALKNAGSKAARDSIKSISQTVVDRKSINLTNVRIIQKEGTKQNLLSPSNLSATYAYNENNKRDVSNLYDTDKSHHGILAYNYQARPKAIEPFKNSKLFKGNAFALIRDFNFYFVPSQIGYRWEIIRDYTETQTRNVSQPNLQIPVSVSQDFNWNRYFDLNFPLSKSLRLDFKSATNARIDEPYGQVNKKLNPDAYQEWKDSVIQNILRMGRVTNYTHNTNLTYNVPINKFPMLDWTTATVRYSSMYAWITGPTQLSELGNTIRNTSNLQTSGQLNFTNLYNKSSYLKGLDRKYNSRKQSSSNQQKKRTERFNKDGVTIKAGRPFIINHKLKTETLTVKVFDKNGRPVNGETKVLNSNKIEFTTPNDVVDGRIMVTGTVEDVNTPFTVITDYTALLLTGIKNASVQYNEANGMILPGFMPGTGFMGMNDGSPGIPFIFGFQPDNFPQSAIDKGWLTTDASFSSPTITTSTEDFNFKVIYEPIKGLKLDLSGLRRMQLNQSSYYLPQNGGYTTPIESGNFSISVNTFKTAFWKVESKGSFSSKAYENFLDNRSVVQARMGSAYTNNSQDVVIPAFVAAYTNKDPNKVTLNSMPDISHIQPNWRITYDGLSRINLFKKYIKTFEISHAYNSTYQIGSFISNSSGAEKYQISSVTINEQLNPLIQFNIVWANSLSTRAEVKKGRILNLSSANSQLIESRTNEWVIGLGYRIDKLNINIGNKAFSSDVNLRCDLSIRDNLSIIRKYEEAVDQLTAGQKVVTAKFTADYALSDKFTMQLYYDTNVTNPYIQLSYPMATTNFGLSFRFTLTQ